MLSKEVAAVVVDAEAADAVVAGRVEEEDEAHLVASCRDPTRLAGSDPWIGCSVEAVGVGTGAKGG